MKAAEWYLTLEEFIILQKDWFSSFFSAANQIKAGERFLPSFKTVLF